jgi:hypothetical protein
MNLALKDVYDLGKREKLLSSRLGEDHKLKKAKAGQKARMERKKNKEICTESFLNRI